MVQEGAMNGYVLYKKSMTRREYINNLAKQLMKEQKKKKKIHWQTDIFRQIEGLYEK